MSPPNKSNPFVWHPSQSWIDKANITRLIHTSNADSLPALLDRARNDPDWLYKQVSRDLGIEWFDTWSEVCDVSDGKPWARWFVGARLNIEHNCVDRHVHSGQGSRMAILWEGQDGTSVALTYEEFQHQIASVSAAMRASGIEPGDRVVLYLPMIPEAIVSLFACFRMGAIAVSAFSGYGADALAQRVGPCQAKLLICADLSLRGSKQIDMLTVAQQAVQQCPDVQQTVVVSRFNQPLALGPSAVNWQDWLDEASGVETKTESLSAEHPAVLAFTSGSTGKPKGTILTHAGMQMRMAIDWAYNFDVKREDVVLWVTDMGWIMAPYTLIGAFTAGATVVAMEGVPNQPAPDRIWRLIERHRATIFGASPTLIRAMAESGRGLADACDLSSLRLLGSSGEPWDEIGYRWFHEVIGAERCPIINASGGTEVGSALLSVYPIEPIKACSVGRPAIGMDLDIVDDNGQSTSHLGELVCRNISPSMTKGFWKDNDRYLEAYWSRIPDVWTHADLAQRDSDGYWFLRGRTDDTMKIGGKRVGPNEIESILLESKQITQAIVVGVADPVKGQRIIAFVVSATPCSLSDDQLYQMAETVAERMGRPFRPAAVIVADDLPRTRTGKMMRRVLRRVCDGTQDLGDLSSLGNEKSIESVRQAWSAHLSTNAERIKH